jgi:hypothetical protein
MPETYFILCGVIDDCTPVFWHKDNGWLLEESQATQYDKSILTVSNSYPDELGLIVEKTQDGKHIRAYAPLMLPHCNAIFCFESMQVRS